MMNWLIHYPVWELEAFGGGFWIALIATIHVYVAHFAVGAGLFLVLTEMKAYRENSSAILDYTKKHSKLFLLISMVFGSITGVGIWFIISILSPAATSVLIHEFIFAWATEWVFFLGEIITLFVYFYAFDKMEKRDHGCISDSAGCRCLSSMALWHSCSRRAIGFKPAISGTDFSIRAFCPHCFSEPQWHSCWQGFSVLSPQFI